jgi:hypothetical protein
MGSLCGELLDSARSALGPKAARGTGRACPLSPGISDVDLFRYGKRVVNLDAQIPDGALDFGVAQRQLHGSQVADSPVDKGRLRSA